MSYSGKIDELIDERDLLRKRVKVLEETADKAADSALKFSCKYNDLVQAITDPENQPNQYGVVPAVHLNQAHNYATRIAWSTWNKHYREIVQNWEPCGDLMGVLTQIDNMLTGLTYAKDAA